MVRLTPWLQVLMTLELLISPAAAPVLAAANPEATQTGASGGQEGAQAARRQPSSQRQGTEAVRLGAVTLEQSVVDLFGLCELTVELSGIIRNPYDPQEVDLEALFHPPEGQPVRITGFYYQPFRWDREHAIEPLGHPTWKIRFTPRQAGKWSYTVRVKTPQGVQTAPGGTFMVRPSIRRGFVELNRTTGYFQFTTGRPFLPIGENLAWGPSGQVLPAYEKWFRELARQHANYIRVWMAPWSFRLETKETGLGRYDQLRAWQLDYLLERSEQAGLFWQLCLLEHGSFSRTQDPEWQNNPYNAELGGICRLPNDFLKDGQARRLFKQLLRYMVARWGYSPQLASWELFNEVDLSELRMEEVVPWVADMSQELHLLDINRRPITMSFHKADAAAVWSLPTIDTIQWHQYDQRDFPSLFCGPTIPSLKQRFGKPVMVGEFGWISEFVRQVDDRGIHVHDGLWSSLMGGAMGSAMIWYWDLYVHPNKLEQHYRPLARFWATEQPTPQWRRVEVSFKDEDLVGCGIGSPQRAFLWVKNRTHNVDNYLAYRGAIAKQRLLAPRGEAPEPLSYPPRVIQGGTASIAGLAPWGRYRVEWWDPYGDGGRLTRSVASVRHGVLTVEVPELASDVAAKLVKLHWWEQE